MVTKILPVGETTPTPPSAVANGSVATVQDAIAIATHIAPAGTPSDPLTIAGDGFDHFALTPDLGNATIYGSQGDIQLAALALDPMAPLPHHAPQPTADLPPTDDSGYALSVALLTPDTSQTAATTSNADDSDMSSLLGPRSIDGIAVHTLGGFDHNHSAVFGGQEHYVPPPSYVGMTNIPIPEFTFAPSVNWDAFHSGLALAQAQVANDQNWLNNEQIALGVGFYDQGQAAAGNVAGDPSAAQAYDVDGYKLAYAIDNTLFSPSPNWVYAAAGGTANLATGAGFDTLVGGNGSGDLITGWYSVGDVMFSVVTFVSPFRGYEVNVVTGSAEVAQPGGWTIDLGSGMGMGSGSAPAFALGTDGSVVIDSYGVGPATLSGGNATLTLDYPTSSQSENVVGGGDANVLASGGFADTLIGGAGAHDTNTFILNADDSAWQPPVVQIENFRAAHDTIELPAGVYPGFSQAAATSGPNENVFVLANDAAAQTYSGSGPAVLVVGSGQNADIYYYAPNGFAGPYGQPASGQIAVVDNARAVDVAAAIVFSLSDSVTLSPPPTPPPPPSPPPPSPPPTIMQSPPPPPPPHMAAQDGYQLAALPGDHTIAAHHPLPATVIHPAHG